MRSWLPTAAYNCEAAHHLRQMFTAKETVEDAMQGVDADEAKEASGDEEEEEG
jgi:hypothetical protein